MQVQVGDSSLFDRNIISFEFMSSCMVMIRAKMNDNSFMSRLLDNCKTVYVLHMCTYIHLLINNLLFFPFVYLQIWCIAQTNRMSRFPIWPIYLSNAHRMPIGWSFINR